MHTSCGTESAAAANVMRVVHACSQFCVYWRGEKVVDLWGSQAHEFEYGPDSVQVCMSCTKVLTSICVAMAVDRGYFKYEDTVAQHWPEFAQNGKGHITVAQVGG